MGDRRGSSESCSTVVATSVPRKLPESRRNHSGPRVPPTRTSAERKRPDSPVASRMAIPVLAIAESAAAVPRMMMVPGGPIDGERVPAEGVQCQHAVQRREFLREKCVDVEHSTRGQASGPAARVDAQRITPAEGDELPAHAVADIRPMRRAAAGASDVGRNQRRQAGECAGKQSSHGCPVARPVAHSHGEVVVQRLRVIAFTMADASPSSCPTRACASSTSCKERGMPNVLPPRPKDPLAVPTRCAIEHVTASHGSPQAPHHPDHLPDHHPPHPRGIRLQGDLDDLAFGDRDAAHPTGWRPTRAPPGEGSEHE